MPFAIRSLPPAAIRSAAIRPVAIRSAARGALPALGLALLLGACTAPQGGAGTGAAWSPLSAGGNAADVNSLTAQRIRGANPEFAPLGPEAGNVWPAQEGPRPTLLGSPEEAMRNIPEYRPSLIEGAPPARSPISPQPERATRGSSSPPPPPPAVRQAPPPAAAQAPSGRSAPPPPRTEGRALTDPSGRPAVSTGQAGSIQGFTQPGGGGGAVIRDGNVETWIGPDGQARTRIVPR
jgi:hypothetical protein